MKLGTRLDAKATSVKLGQDPLTFEKNTIKEKFYTEFKDRWHASVDSVESAPRTCTDQGRFGQELDREVTMSELNTVISKLKNKRHLALTVCPMKS